VVVGHHEHRGHEVAGEDRRDGVRGERRSEVLPEVVTERCET
jgi:hypothetical protein